MEPKSIIIKGIVASIAHIDHCFNSWHRKSLWKVKLIIKKTTPKAITLEFGRNQQPNLDTEGRKLMDVMPPEIKARLK